MEGDDLTAGASADRSGICGADFGPVTDGQATLAHVGLSAAGHGDVAETGGSRGSHLDRRRELGSAHDGRFAGLDPRPGDRHGRAAGIEALTVDGDRVLGPLGNPVVDDAADPEGAWRAGHESCTGHGRGDRLVRRGANNHRLTGRADLRRASADDLKPDRRQVCVPTDRCEGTASNLDEAVTGLLLRHYGKRARAVVEAQDAELAAGIGEVGLYCVGELRAGVDPDLYVQFITDAR